MNIEHLDVKTHLSSVDQNVKYSKVVFYQILITLLYHPKLKSNITIFAGGARVSLAGVNLVLDTPFQ